MTMPEELCPLYGASIAERAPVSRVLGSFAPLKSKKGGGLDKEYGSLLRFCESYSIFILEMETAMGTPSLFAFQTYSHPWHWELIGALGMDTAGTSGIKSRFYS